jgi:hydroxymethylpyrimidine pyrophosphatase-like HAD family hydrolase
VPTTIITGRLFSGTREAARIIGATGAVACMEGCHVVDAPTGRELFHGGMSGTIAAEVRTLVAKAAAASFLFAHDRIFYDARGLPHLGYVRTWSVDHVETDAVAEHAVWEHERGLTAIVCVGSQADIQALDADLRRAVGHAVYSTAFPARRREGEPATWGMVVRAAGYSKGTAVRWLAAHYGVEPSEVVVVGDWFNDIPMFEVAGRSFVMAQAPEEVKRAATDRLHADAVSGGGVAEAAVRSGLL